MPFVFVFSLNNICDKSAVSVTKSKTSSACVESCIIKHNLNIQRRTSITFFIYWRSMAVMKVQIEGKIKRRDRASVFCASRDRGIWLDDNYLRAASSDQSEVNSTSACLPSVLMSRRNDVTSKSLDEPTQIWRVSEWRECVIAERKIRIRIEDHKDFCPQNSTPFYCSWGTFRLQWER